MGMSDMGLLSVKVAKKNNEAEGICSFELVSADDRPLVPFTAGAHVDVHIADGLIRQYSLCNDPVEQHRYLIATLRDANSRGGSVAMHEKVAVGDVLRISEPRNHFALVPAARYLLLAGGIGITPILCMAERLSGESAEFELHYCARSPARTAFRSRIGASSFVDRAHFHYDTGPAEQKLDMGALLARQPQDTHLFVCGPAGFISHVVNSAGKSGWPEARIHLEHFGAAPADTSADAGFDVRVASSGRTYFVPSGKTVIEVLAAEGIEVPVSCEAGVCGTCLTGVLEGTPEHRDLFLSDDEHARNDQFTPCCSRARSALLVLDL
jgi:vanillate O-demethylase ferredoxin subunit